MYFHFQLSVWKRRMPREIFKDLKNANNQHDVDAWFLNYLVEFSISGKYVGKNIYLKDDHSLNKSH